jgi:hypothetical protein
MAIGLVAIVATTSPLAWCQSLAEIPIEMRTGALGSGAPSLRAALYVRNVEGLARSLGAPPSQVRQDHVEYVLAQRTIARDVPPADWLRSSFIVDFAESDVQRLTAKLRQEHGGAAITADQVVRFVANSMTAAITTNKDTASEVARSLEGDCTEHALLTTALARSVGIPARMVHGAAVLVQDKKAIAYGHAWVEMQVNGVWTLGDAALIDETAVVYHIPAMVISEEGPGYMLGMMEGLSLALQKVVLSSDGG